MGYLDYPSEEEWKERQQWMEVLIFKYEEKGSYVVSEQACALIGEAQTTFCAGAWIAVIVLATAAIDSQLREVEVPGFKGNTKKLLKYVNANPELQILRERRNRIVHIDINNPAITITEQWDNQQYLEKQARDAIERMLELFFENPSI